MFWNKNKSKSNKKRDTLIRYPRFDIGKGTSGKLHYLGGTNKKTVENDRSLLISGMSGYGKTYFVKELLDKNDLTVYDKVIIICEKEEYLDYKHVDNVEIFDIEEDNFMKPIEDISSINNMEEIIEKGTSYLIIVDVPLGNNDRMDVVLHTLISLPITMNVTKIITKKQEDSTKEIVKMLQNNSSKIINVHLGKQPLIVTGIETDNLVTEDKDKVKNI